MGLDQPHDTDQRSVPHDAGLLDALVAPDLAPLFWRPARSGVPSAWYGHVPFAHWIVRACRPGLLVELGTHNGVSYSAFCDAVRRERLATQCIAVDTWEGDVHAGFYGEDAYADFAAFHAVRYADFSRLLRGTFDAALAQVPDGAIDLLHIDGQHHYEDVRHDFESWTNKLSPRAVVLFHDTNVRERDFGVWRLWAELAEQRPSFEFFHAHGLGVLAWGRAVPAPVRALCALAHPADIAAVRERFALIGERWEATMLERTLAEARDVAARETAARRSSEQDAQARIAALAAERDDAVALAREACASARRASAEAAAHSEAAARLAEDAAARNASELRAADARIAALEAARHADAVAAAARADALAAEAAHEREGRLAAEHAHAAVSAARDAILASTSWRLLAPVQRLGGALPTPVRRGVRRGARLAWWAATPWRTRTRLRLLRARATPAVALPPPAVPDAPDDYAAWIDELEPAVWTAPDLPDDGAPRITFLIDTEGVSSGALHATVAALVAQRSRPWRALLHVPRGALSGAEPIDRRLTLLPPTPFGELLVRAETEFVAVLRAGDVLSPHAVCELLDAVAQDPALDVVYSDEDRLDACGARTAPRLKPGWSPDLLASHDYLGRVTLLRRTAALAAGGFRPGPLAEAEWMLHRALDTPRVARVPKVLCHRADAPAAPVAVTHAPPPDPPLVSVIVTMPPLAAPGDAATFHRCVEALAHGTDYPRIEIVALCPDGAQARALASKATVVAPPVQAGAAHVRNWGAAAATGSLLLFLDGDLVPAAPDWLATLVSWLHRPGVGIAGARIAAHDGTVLHGGIAAGVDVCTDLYRGASADVSGVFGAPSVPRTCLAVSGACLLVRRDVFAHAGGFDETYALANADIALALAARRAGWRTVYAADSLLLRDADPAADMARPAADMVRLARDLRRHGIAEDPYFHPQLSPAKPVPQLRRAPEPTAADRLAADIADWLFGMTTDAPDDLGDETAVAAALGCPWSAAFWPPLRAAGIADASDAARWTIDLLRLRLDLRLRFPRALSDGPDGAFAAFLAGPEGAALGLSPSAAACVAEAFAARLGALARTVFLFRDDLRALFPLGTTPHESRRLLRWFARYSHAQHDIPREAIAWFFFEIAEDPGREFVRLFNDTPSWQAAVPDGATVFGRRRLAAWIAAKYRAAPQTVDPRAWPLDLPPAHQLRLAWLARPEWRAAFPGAFTDPAQAAALLAHLRNDADIDPDARAWCRALDVPATAAAMVAQGVNLLGHFCFPSGLRSSAEAIARALARNGVTPVLRDLRTDIADLPDHTAFTGLELFDTTILHMQPEPFFLVAYDRANLHPRSPRTHRIAYWYWEMDSVPAYWADVASGEGGAPVDEFWAASDFVADALRARVSVPVHTMFPGLELAPFTPRSRAQFGLKRPGAYTFLFVFNMLSVMERKNPLGVIAAFRDAFGPDEDVQLVLKTSFGERHPEVFGALREAAAAAGATLIDAIYTQDETLALIDACDCFVSLHRSEGLGLAIAEAMLLGKPVIATGYSGNMQFMTNENSLPVDYTLVPVGPGHAPYEPDMRWAEPSIAHAGALMRRVYSERDWAAALGANARADLRANHSPEAAGARMARRLAEIAATRPR
jgi:glycosyltransferase involved in cell wall biosynthesis